jgi:regulator of protease activity HflC (stomatin/prohibitin superfamily)
MNQNNEDVEAAVPFANVVDLNHHHRDDSTFPRGTAFRQSNKNNFIIFGIISTFIYIFSSIRSIPPSNVGLVNLFGAVSEEMLSPGLNFVNPLATVITFNTRTLLLYSENIVPTQEGMNVELDVSLLYHAEPKQIRDLYLGLGETYEKTLILPELQSAVRGLTSEVSAKALYTSGRTLIRSKLMDDLKEKLEPRGIVLEDVLLKGIKLPLLLTDAIETKAKAEQESQRMEFVLSKEKQEADRKRIEAEGVASFQKIVSDGISPQLLQWKGIEATEKLAESQNAKIVIMGNTKSSLPVLLSAPEAEDKDPGAVQPE